MFLNDVAPRNFFKYMFIIDDYATCRINFLQENYLHFIFYTMQPMFKAQLLKIEERKITKTIACTNLICMDKIQSHNCFQLRSFWV